MFITDFEIEAVEDGKTITVDLNLGFIINDTTADTTKAIRETAIKSFRFFKMNLIMLVASNSNLSFFVILIRLII